MCWYSHLAGGTEVQVKFMPDRLIIIPLNQMVTLEVLFCYWEKSLMSRLATLLTLCSIDFSVNVFIEFAEISN